MKKAALLVFVALLVFSLSGCALFKYHLSWEMPDGSRASKGVWEVREVYYSEDPTALGGYHGVPVIMQNALGIEPTGPVEWEISDPTIGELANTWGVPSQRDFLPAATGIQAVREAVVAATFEDQTATTKIVVFPSVRFSVGNGVDLDGDGVNDIESKAENVARFPFGMRIISASEIFPVNLGELSVETEAPLVEDVSQRFTSWRLIIFNTSLGRKFAGVFGGGDANHVILWRPLDIVY